MEPALASLCRPGVPGQRERLEPPVREGHQVLLERVGAEGVGDLELPGFPSGPSVRTRNLSPRRKNVEVTPRCVTVAWSKLPSTVWAVAGSSPGHDRTRGRLPSPWDSSAHRALPTKVGGGWRRHGRSGRLVGLLTAEHQCEGDRCEAARHPMGGRSAAGVELGLGARRRRLMRPARRVGPSSMSARPGDRFLRRRSRLSPDGRIALRAPPTHAIMRGHEAHSPAVRDGWYRIGDDAPNISVITPRFVPGLGDEAAAFREAVRAPIDARPFGTRSARAIGSRW